MNNSETMKTQITLIENEVWKPVVGWEGIYEVSNMGRVKSLPRKITSCVGTFVSDERILTGGVSNGYHHVLLKDKGRKKDMRVNRLVAMAFIPNPSNLPYVNHKDENPLNNRVENLEWCTALYNLNYGNARQKSSLHNGNNRKVCQFDMDGKLITSYYNINQAVKSIGGQHSTIVQCCQRKRLSYKGYIWLYQDDINGIDEVVALNQKSNNFHRILRIERQTGIAAQFGSISEATRSSNRTRNQINLRLIKPQLDKEYIWKRI